LTDNKHPIRLQELYINMSNKIKLLVEQVANQIAAGEVVDRPSSVVKELIENSLDAQAGRISVDVEQGGRRLIKVTDNGSGMSEDDALMCLERHATSKVRTASDLFSINTLGFRGEAIPSIASVSKMIITTREKEADLGTKIIVNAGKIKSVTETGAPEGTEITVTGLFHNIPARRKFLKTVQTEFGHINTLVANMALASPETHATLTHNGKTIFDLPSSQNLSGRLRHALGADAVGHLVEINKVYSDIMPEGDLKVHGFVSVPSYTRSSTRSLHIFVNKRFIRDKLINHAVFEAYRALIPKKRYPLVVLFIDLPPASVDVNVHPAKHEIRFREQAGVHDAVKGAITGALKKSGRAGVAIPSEMASARPFRQDNYPHLPISANRENFPDRAESRPISIKDSFREGPEPEYNISPTGPLAEKGDCSFETREGDQTYNTGQPSFRFSELRIVGQISGTYILCESDDSLVMIDQHAAHERVAFEKLWTQFHSESVLKQALLFPVTVEMTYEEAVRVSENVEILEKVGLEVEPFGGNTIIVKAVPALLTNSDPEQLLVEVADRLGDVKGHTGIEDYLDEVFALMACHSVVRGNEKLKMEEMKAILTAMDDSDFPGSCPHGRDVVVKLGFTEIAKWFQR
jgi:DNA mismatch repair protein MutL